MPTETWHITTREEWLERRRHDITGSVAAALLGAHERMTPLQIYLDKVGVLPLDNGDNPAMRRGRLLEPLAVTLIKEAHPDWEVWPSEDYVRDPEHRIAVTPDVYVRDEAKRFGVIEIKSVEPGVFYRTWLEEDGTIRPTTASIVQVSLARHLLRAEFAMVGVLRVGHAVDFDLIEIPEAPGLIEKLEEAAAELWRCIERNEPPPPIFPDDADAIIQQAKSIKTSTASVELPEGDNYFPEILAEYVRNNAEIKARSERCKTIKAEVLHKMGPATKLTQNGKVLATAKLCHKKAEEKPRAGYPYRDFRIPAGAVNL